MEKVTDVFTALGWCWCVKRTVSFPGINTRIPMFWVIGPSVVDKDSVAIEVSKKTNFVLINIPDILRRTKLQDPVSEATILNLIDNEIKSKLPQAEGFVILGFPDNLYQARLFIREIYEPRMILYLTLCREDIIKTLGSIEDADLPNDLENFNNELLQFDEIYRKFETKTLKIIVSLPAVVVAERIVLYLEAYYGLRFSSRL